MTKELSRQLCELCKVKPNQDNCNPCQKCCICEAHLYDPNNKLRKYKSVENCKNNNFKYPDFGKPNNFVKLLELLVKNNCTLTFQNNYYSVGVLGYDIVNDFCDEETDFTGDTFLCAVINYLKLWRKEQMRAKLPNGKMGDWIDVSHKLERDECYYRDGYDELLKGVNKVKQAIKNTEWEY